ncbi:MAG: hypothetical protein ACTSQE_16720, partial [Candidatus Heimdallarchaeaceae archaeon]
HRVHPDKPLGSSEAFQELKMFYDIAKTKTPQLAKNKTVIDWFRNVFAKKVENATTKALTGREITPAIKPTPITPKIPSELQPLAKEALKYRSAEEFVKSFKHIGYPIKNIGGITISQKMSGDSYFFEATIDKSKGFFLKTDDAQQAYNIAKDIQKKIKTGDTKIFTDKTLIPKSQLKNIYNQAHQITPEAQKGVKEAVKPEISPITPTLPATEQVVAGKMEDIIIPNQQEQVSVFKNFINPKTLNRTILDTSDIAIRTTKAGNKVPAIRKSGFFATKDIETAPIRDVYQQVQSPHHMALIQDGYKLGGKFGTIFKKVWIPTKTAIVSTKEFHITSNKEFKDILKKYHIPITKKNGELLSDMLEGKTTIPAKYTDYVKDVRTFLDKQRNTANAIREKMGKETIGYIEDYVPHIQKSILWNELLNNRATISDSLDFIIPNAAKNPFAFRRVLEELPKAERNFFVLIDRYNNAIAKDLHITPAIENIKAYNSVLKNRGLNNAAKYWDEYIRTGLVGKQHKLDTSLSIGQKGRKSLQKWNQMVNSAFLTGKIAWNIATQPLSYITLTPTETGYWNATKAIAKMFNKGMRQFAQDNSLSLKIKSGDILANAVGEGRTIVNGIYRTPIDKWNAAISTIGSIEEQILHETSFIAGLDKAKRLGYKGQDAIDFADLVAERTQSMYNKENRALILNSDFAKALFPFQSFATEMYNHAREIGTTSGAMKLKFSQRIGKLLRLLAGIYLANLYAKSITGKKKTTVGTFIPFIGQFVDAAISKITGQEYYSGRSPFTVIQQVDQIIKGSKDYIKYGSLKALRKVGVNFGTAACGIGGGGQINNIIDGVMADINEEVKNVSGERMFRVEDITSKIKAPIFGVWATKGGREYWQGKEKSWLDIFEGKTEEEQFEIDKKQALSELESKIYKGTVTTSDIAEALKKGYIENSAKALKKFIIEAKLPDDIKKFSRLRTIDQVEVIKNASVEDRKRFIPFVNQNFAKVLREEAQKPKIPEGKTSDTNLIHTIALYAKAIGTDPLTAFNRIFTGQKIRRIDSGTIIV